MSWTTPATVNGGQAVSATFWNQQIRDNLNELFEPPITVASRRSTSQSISHNVWTSVTFDTEIVDNAGGFSPPSTNVTCKKSGIYQVNYAFAIDFFNDQFESGVQKNGTGNNLFPSETYFDCSTIGATWVNHEFSTSLSENDYLQLRIKPDVTSGGSTLISYAYLSIVFMGAT